jgi:hypothetical protein
MQKAVSLLVAHQVPDFRKLPYKPEFNPNRGRPHRESRTTHRNVQECVETVSAAAYQSLSAGSSERYGPNAERSFAYKHL